MSYYGSRSTRSSGSRTSSRKYAKSRRSSRGVTKPRSRGIGAMRNIRNTNATTRPEELKYFDIASAAYPCSTSVGAGVEITLLNPVPGGSTVTARVGNQMWMKSISITGVVKPVDATIIRSRSDIYIVYDKTPAGAMPTKTDILVEAISGSNPNLDYRDRFILLAHQSFVIGGLFASAEALSPTVQTVNINKRFNLKTTFNNEGAVIANIKSGALYMMLVSDQAAADSTVFRVVSRLRFAER